MKRSVDIAMDLWLAQLSAAARAVVEAQQRFLEAPDGASSLHASHVLSEKIERLREALDD